MHPEVEQLLQASPKMKHLAPGCSDLAQATFKMIRNTNMMRAQGLLGEKDQDRKFMALKDEIYQQKKALDESIADYKLSLIREKEEKKQIQNENKGYWHKQMDWRQNKLNEMKIENKMYDPELVWNIEGPTRKKTDAARR